MNDQEILREYREGIRHSLEYFSNSHKAEREVWVCKGFLAALGVGFSDSELVASDDEPPDVLFRDARFEVKELLDEERRRTDEYRKALRQANEASSVRDLREQFPLIDITPAKILRDLEEKLAGWAQRYESTFCASLDMLIYYNRHGIFKPSDQMPDVSRVSALGFRSISTFTGSQSWILFASDGAPAILVENVGVIKGV
jgi:hypothetical protein